MTEEHREIVPEEFQQIVEMADEISAPSQEIIVAISEKLIEKMTEEPIEERVENPKIKGIATNVTEILTLIKVSNRKDEIIDNLHQELQEYKNGLKEALIAPLLKAIVREYGKASKQYQFYLEKSQSEPQSELFGKLLSEFEMLSSSLLNLLIDYDIEPFGFNTGDAHDNKLQEIVEIIETEDSQQDGTVAECVARGFSNIDKARLFHRAKVKIYKLKK